MKLDYIDWLALVVMSLFAGSMAYMIYTGV